MLPKLSSNEYVIIAWAEYCNGPGWSNAIIWYMTRNKITGIVERKCIQPEEQNNDMMLLFSINATVSKQFTSLVEKALL